MIRLISLCIGLSVIAGSSWAYPIDGYSHSEIRRVEYTWRVYTGDVPGTALPPGAKQRLDSVVPRYLAGGAHRFR